VFLESVRADLVLKGAQPGV